MVLRLIQFGLLGSHGPVQMAISASLIVLGMIQKEGAIKINDDCSE